MAKSALHCQGLDLPEVVHVSVLLCDDPTIQEINQTWRQEDKPTDVLSFPMHEPEELATLLEGGQIHGEFELGDIIINLDYVQRLLTAQTHRARVASELGVAAEELEWGSLEEIEFLFIHGLLHLTGHDHAEPDEEALMKREERRLWQHSHQG